MNPTPLEAVLFYFGLLALLCVIAIPILAALQTRKERKRRHATIAARTWSEWSVDEEPHVHVIRPDFPRRQVHNVHANLDREAR